MARLACVVLSYQSQPTVVAAVRSLAAQAGDAELVVVNSGGGDAPAVLRRAGLDVPVVHADEHWYVGRARNEGIAATTAPFVAFLAADCLAEAGWVDARLRAHEAGALVVASAVTNAYPRNPFAWASYLDLFKRRRPVGNVNPLLYGASYARELFDRYGAFRPDLETGEDSELHDRFGGEVELAWVPAVRCAHRGPTGPVAFVRDHFRRGRRAGRYYLAQEDDTHWRAAARGAFWHWRTSAAIAWEMRRECPSPAALAAGVAVQPVGIAARVAGLASARLGAHGAHGAHHARGRPA